MIYVILQGKRTNGAKIGHLASTVNLFEARELCLGYIKREKLTKQQWSGGGVTKHTGTEIAKPYAFITFDGKILAADKVTPHPDISLLKIAKNILAKLDHPHASVTQWDADELRDAIDREETTIKERKESGKAYEDSMFDFRKNATPEQRKEWEAILGNK